MRLQGRTLLPLALAACLFAAAPASALPPDQAVMALNAQREAHGIPGGIAHVPDWSRWCALHNEYQRLNGGVLTHDEEPGKPGYTEEGDKAAGASVLSAGQAWDSGNPWETAPIHLHQLLAPRLDAMGVDDGGGFTCATTLLSRDRPPASADTVFVYPGPGTRHRASERAEESPYTPGQRVGIPRGATTGPYIYLSIDGPGVSTFAKARVDAASVTGPDGPVEVKTVDNFTSGLEGYLPAGGQVIPVQPLQAGTPYTVSVRLSLDGSPGRVFERTWTFETDGREPESSFDIGVEDGVAFVALRSLSPAAGAVRATRPATGEVVEGAAPPAQRATLALPPGTWNVCLSQRPEGGFRGYARCAPGPAIVPAATPALALGQAAKRTRRTRKTLKIPVTFDPVLAGRPLTVTTKRFKRTCRRSRPRRTCRLRQSGGVKASTVTAASGLVLSAPRPGRGGKTEVTIGAGPFANGDVPVPGALATRRFGG